MVKKNNDNRQAINKKAKQKSIVVAKFGKTFGLEGSESLIPGLSALFSRCSELGIQHVELGMAHRGRLNVLMNIMGKSMGTVCTEFNEQVNHDDADINAEKNALKIRRRSI